MREAIAPAASRAALPVDPQRPELPPEVPPIQVPPPPRMPPEFQPDQGPSVPEPADARPPKGPIEVPEPPGNDVIDPPGPSGNPPSTFSCSDKRYQADFEPSAQ